MNDYSRTNRSLDDQIESAWLAFRDRLIADFDHGFDILHHVNSDDESDIYTNDLTIGVADGREMTTYVVNPPGENPVIWMYQTEVTDEDQEPIDITSDESIEAVNKLIEVLRDSWGVVHPAFLELSRDPEIAGQTAWANTLALGVDGFEADKDQLRDLVRQTIDELNGHDFEWVTDDVLKISTPDGHLGAVMARSKTNLEIWTIVADGLDAEIARQVTLDLLENTSPYKFLPQEGSVLMSTLVHCMPYDPKAFLQLLAIHLNATDNIFKDAQKYVTKAEQSAAIIAEAEIDSQSKAEIGRLKENHAAEVARLVSERDSAEHELRQTKISIARKTRSKALIHAEVVNHNKELLGIIESLEIDLEEARDQLRWYQTANEDLNLREH